jgi:hypothetical protein
MLVLVEDEHKRLMLEAITAEGDGHRAALDGDAEAAAAAYRAAASAYRASWEAAPPGAYGRLVGMLKAAVLAGGGTAEARYAREQIADEAAAHSPTAAYALAVAALLEADDEAAAAWAGAMRAGGEAFDRAGTALLAIARGDADGYAAALEAIVTDFAARADHLTGVRIADTAVLLEALAEPRGLAARPESPLLPAVSR